MIKLLVIADDFTGAMDTGVQFRARDTVIQVAPQGREAFQKAAGGGVQVLILDAETRHLPPEEAGRVVGQIVRWAVEAGVPCIYKKTDSGLRGNIGSELTAMLEASGQPRLHFIPAFPLLGRTTAEGVHYINGCPVAESVFGSDPFEPVRHSSIREIIASQSPVDTTLIAGPLPGELPGGVLIYDAATDQDLSRIAEALRERGELRLLSGCAGFAAVLPRLLELEPDQARSPLLEQKLVTICGSINPITLRQLDEAERWGALRLQLDPAEKLDPGWLDSGPGQAALERWLARIQGADMAIVEGNRTGEGDATARYARDHGLSLEDLRERIAWTMGGVLAGLLDRGLEATVLVTGGDTLLAFLRRVRQDTLIPVGELAPGVVLAQIEYRGKRHSIISKSGGFGPASLLLDLKRRLGPDHSKEEQVC